MKNIIFAIAIFLIPLGASADVYGEDFDAVISDTWGETIFDTFSVTQASISTESYCISLPKCARGQSGSIQRMGLTVEPIESGVISALIMHTNTSATISGVAVGDTISASDFALGSFSDDKIYLTDTSMSFSLSLGTMTLNEWYSVVLQWRTNESGIIEIRGTANGLGIATTTDWHTTGYNIASYSSMIPMIELQSNFSSSAILDNFFLNTDYEEPQEQTWIEITSPSEGGNTDDRTFDIGFTYTLDNRVLGASEYDYIKFTVCSLFYQNEPCATTSYSTSFGVDQNATTSITATWDGYSLLTASYWNGVSQSTTCPWWNFLCQEEQVLIGPSDSIKLNIATTTIQADVPDWILDADICGMMASDIGNGFCQAIVFLFFPTDKGSESIENIREILAQKQPFGFFFLVSERMDSLFKTEGAVGNSLVINLGDAWGSWTVFDFATAKGELVKLGVLDDSVISLLIMFIYIGLIGYWWKRTTGQEDTGNNTWQRGV